MENFEIIDFTTLSKSERKRILRESINDMDRVAMQRKREGLNPRAFFLQFQNLRQVEKLNCK